MGTRLYAGNLSFNAAAEDLQRPIQPAGRVVRCELMIDKCARKSRGFAFVEMGSPAKPDEAIQQFHQQDFQDRQLVVNEARPCEERGPRGGGYFDFGYAPQSGGGHDRGRRSLQRPERARRERQEY
jgi:cold-inducible RNA-binding protein